MQFLLRPLQNQGPFSRPLCPQGTTPSSGLGPAGPSYYLLGPIFLFAAGSTVNLPAGILGVAAASLPPLPGTQHLSPPDEEVPLASPDDMDAMV